MVHSSDSSSQPDVVFARGYYFYYYTIVQWLRGGLFTSLLLQFSLVVLDLEIVMVGTGVSGLLLLLAALPLWWRMTCLMYPLMAGAESGEANPATAPPLPSPLRRCRLLHSHILPRLVSIYAVSSQWELRLATNGKQSIKRRLFLQSDFVCSSSKQLGPGKGFFPFSFSFSILGANCSNNQPVMRSNQSVITSFLTVNAPYTYYARICPIKSIIMQIYLPIYWLYIDRPQYIATYAIHFVLLKETKC